VWPTDRVGSAQQDFPRALVILVLLPGTYIRFDSLRTGETLLEAKRLNGALIVHGHASRDHYDVGIDGADVMISGTLWDRRGPAVSFGADALRFHTKGDRRLRRTSRRLRRDVDAELRVSKSKGWREGLASFRQPTSVCAPVSWSQAIIRRLALWSTTSRQGLAPARSHLVKHTDHSVCSVRVKRGPLDEARPLAAVRRRNA